MYYSNYGAYDLTLITAKLKSRQDSKREVWCIFDNTAAFHALPNALDVAEQVGFPTIVAFAPQKNQVKNNEELRL